MQTELNILLATAASLGVVHTALGPDHYLPFIALSKSRNWSMFKTAWVTALCGSGHVGSSILIGGIGIAAGIGISKIELIESGRGDLAAWLFVIFGALYMAWGIWRGIKNKPHVHLHIHKNGKLHKHQHVHESEHDHIHKTEKPVKMTPWVLFMIFVLGPCEPLVFTLMYPASQMKTGSIILIASVFSIVTLMTMLTIVLLFTYGVKKLPMKGLDRYTHAVAGAIVMLSGLAILYLGL